MRVYCFRIVSGCLKRIRCANSRYFGRRERFYLHSPYSILARIAWNGYRNNNRSKSRCVFSHLIMTSVAKRKVFGKSASTYGDRRRALLYLDFINRWMIFDASAFDVVGTLCHWVSFVVFSVRIGKILLLPFDGNNSIEYCQVIQWVIMQGIVQRCVDNRVYPLGVEDGFFLSCRR